MLEAWLWIQQCGAALGGTIYGAYVMSDALGQMEEGLTKWFESLQSHVCSDDGVRMKDPGLFVWASCASQTPFLVLNESNCMINDNICVIDV